MERVVRASRYLRSIKSQLPIEARADLDRALAGDALAARRLVIVSPKRLLGHVVFLAYQNKTKNPAYRELVRAVWQTCDLLTGFWSPHVVRRMLARADFRSSTLYAAVTIFRPVKTTVRQAATELRWTLSRSVAISQALKANPANPRIAHAAIAPADVLFFGGGAGQEIVTRRSLQTLIVEPVYPGVRNGIANPHESRQRVSGGG
jgi:hypothetical protein